MKSADVDSALPPTWLEDLADAAEQGQLEFVAGVVAEGEATELSASAGSGLVDGVLTDDSFSPAAVVVCVAQATDEQYVEVEISAGAGVPAGLGSLDAALAGIGSSGSVAQTTGSLGS